MLKLSGKPCFHTESRYELFCQLGMSCNGSWVLPVDYWGWGSQITTQRLSIPVMWDEGYKVRFFPPKSSEDFTSCLLLFCWLRLLLNNQALGTLSRQLIYGFVLQSVNPVFLLHFHKALLNIVGTWRLILKGCCSRNTRGLHFAGHFKVNAAWLRASSCLNRRDPRVEHLIPFCCLLAF